jgi:hypothetical protein
LLLVAKVAGVASHQVSSEDHEPYHAIHELASVMVCQSTLSPSPRKEGGRPDEPMLDAYLVLLFFRNTTSINEYVNM